MNLTNGYYYYTTVENRSKQEYIPWIPLNEYKYFLNAMNRNPQPHSKKRKFSLYFSQTKYIPYSHLGFVFHQYTHTHTEYSLWTSHTGKIKVPDGISCLQPTDQTLALVNQASSSSSMLFTKCMNSHLFIHICFINVCGAVVPTNKEKIHSSSCLVLFFRNNFFVVVMNKKRKNTESKKQQKKNKVNTHKQALFE